MINYKGMLYLGSLKEGKPNGIRVLVNEYGLIFKGEYKEGEINGKGKMFIYNKNNINQNKKINSNQRKNNNNNKNLIKIFEGTFINGLKKGKCIVYNEKNSKIFEGEFIDDLRNGKGIEFNNGYKIYEGEFQNGKVMDLEFFIIINQLKYMKAILKITILMERAPYFIIMEEFNIKELSKMVFFGKKDFFDISGEKTKFINGFPSKNKKYIDNFKIYYNSGKIHFCLSQKKRNNKRKRIL